RLTPLVEALQEADADPILLGGAALAAVRYPQLGLRPIVELELAVAPAIAGAARETFAGLGWRLVGGRASGFARFVSSDEAVAAFLHEGLPPFVSGPVSPGRALEQLGERAERRP